MQIRRNPVQFGNRNHYGFRVPLPVGRVGDGDLYPCETRAGSGRWCEQESTEKSGKYEITHVGNGSKGDYSSIWYPISRSATLIFSSVHCTSVPSILRPRPP